MSRGRTVVGGAATLLVLASLALAFWPDEPVRLSVNGATVLFDPGDIFRPGRAEASYLRTQELESVEVGPNDRTLSVKFLGGNPGCWSLDRVRAIFEPGRIALGLYGGYHKLPEGTACPSDGRVYSLTIALDELVRGRPIEAALPVVRGGFVEEDPGGIFRPGRVTADRIKATEVQSVQVAPGGRTVTVRFSGGNSACWSVDQALFRFEANRIVLGIYGGYYPPPNSPPNTFCTTEELTYQLTFRLDQGVARRPLEYVERLSKPL